jgi:1-deoxy-D-xylulose-5-phosphate reductoisomerase
LNEKIKFTDIAKINETSVNKFVSERVASIDDVVTLDASVREFSRNLVENHYFQMSDEVVNKDKREGGI